MTYREDEAREILRRLKLAYGVGTNYGIGERIDPPNYREKDDFEYNSDLGYSEPIGRHDDIDEDIEAGNKACDDE